MTEGANTSEQSDSTVVGDGQQLANNKSDDLPSSDQLNGIASDEQLHENAEIENNPQAPGIDIPITELKPTIAYKIDYFDAQTGESVFIEEASEPLQVQFNRASKETTVLEVVTEVRTLLRSKIEATKSGESKPPPVQDIAVTYVRINSLAIVDALQSVVEYYPGLRFLGSSVSIDEPYRVLAHHEAELGEVRQSFAPGSHLSEEQKCERKAWTYEHLGILDKFVQDAIGASVKAEKQRNAKGYFTFEMMWLLYKPGTDVYYDKDADGNYNGYVVHSVGGGVLNKRKRPLEITLWYLKFNGQCLGRVFHNVTLTPFDGERKVSDAALIPLDYWSESSKRKPESKPLYKRLEERGEMYWRLTTRQCMTFKGDTAASARKHVSCL